MLFGTTNRMPGRRTASAMASASSAPSRALANRFTYTGAIRRASWPAACATRPRGRRAGFHLDRAGRAVARKPLGLRAREFPIEQDLSAGKAARIWKPRFASTIARMPASSGKRNPLPLPPSFVPDVREGRLPDVAVPGRWARINARQPFRVSPDLHLRHRARSRFRPPRRSPTSLSASRNDPGLSEPFPEGEEQPLHHSRPIGCIGVGLRLRRPPPVPGMSVGDRYVRFRRVPVRRRRFRSGRSVGRPAR